MQKREYLLLSLVVLIAIFNVVGHMPTLLADGNSSGNNSGSSVKVRAEVDIDSGNKNEGDDEDDKLEDDEIDDEDDENKTKIKSRELIREGNCTIKVEKEVSIEKGKRVEEVKRKIVCADGTKTEIKVKIENSTEGGRIREKFKYEIKGEETDVETEDEIDLEEETNGTDYKLKARLKDGDFEEIKIMPDTASQIALERLKALNFTIQLKEGRYNNTPRVVYNIEAKKNGKFLGIFKLSLKTDAQVDSQTGELLGVNAPWWAFLVAQQDETTTPSGDETNATNETNSSG